MAWGSTEEVLNVTNSAISQITGKIPGESGIAVLEALTDTAIVDLGEKLGIADENGEIAVNSPADIFFKSLFGQCGKIVVDTQAYVAQLPKLFVDTHEWGIITEMIKVDLSTPMIDEMWNPLGFVSDYAIGVDGKGHSAEGERIAGIEFGNYKPAVHTRLYKKAHSVMYALTRSKEQLFTAFRGVDEYNRFVTALLLSVQNALQLKAEIYGLMALSVGIATAEHNGNEINILPEYNATAATPLTAEQAIVNADFLRFAAARITEIKGNMRRYTNVYNNHESLTFSADTRLVLLNKFVNNMRFFARADTYHESLLSMGEYDTVTTWQANMETGDTRAFEFNAISSISLTEEAMQDITGNSEATAKKFTGIIGFAYDRYALGVTLDKKKVTSQYSATKDCLNEFWHGLLSYVCNPCYGLVSFVVRDVE